MTISKWESCRKIRCGLWIIVSDLNSGVSKWVPTARDKLNCSAALNRKTDHQLSKPGEFQGYGHLRDQSQSTVRTSPSQEWPQTYLRVYAKPVFLQAKPSCPQAIFPPFPYQVVPSLPLPTMLRGKENSWTGALPQSLCCICKPLWGLSSCECIPWQLPEGWGDIF